MDLHDILDDYLGVPIEASGGNEFRYICPFCGSSNQKLFVNNEVNSHSFGQWICFECGEHNWITYVRYWFKLF